MAVFFVKDSANIAHRFWLGNPMQRGFSMNHFSNPRRSRYDAVRHQNLFGYIRPYKLLSFLFFLKLALDLLFYPWHLLVSR